jgi:hypothetical protein
VPPHGDFPVNDDWNHAAAVRGLAERGRLEIGPTTSATLLLQAFWGAAFARLLGFSFDTLRLATLVLAALALVGFNRLLAELFGARRALLGSLALLCNPLFVNLSYSFMTDVPYLCLAVWSMLAYTRALRGDRPALGFAVGGSLLAGGAALVRQLGLLLPFAALAGLLHRRGLRRGVPWGALLTVLGPLLLAAAIGWMVDQQRGPIRQEPLRWTLARWGEQPSTMAVEALLRLPSVALLLGLFTLPLSVLLLRRPAALLRSPTECKTAGLLLLTLAGATGFQLWRDPEPLLLFSVPDLLTPRGFLVDEHFFDNNETVPTSLLLPDGMVLLLTALGALGAVLLVVAVARAMSAARADPRVTGPLVMGALSVGVVLTYFDFYDRYSLSALPWALIAVLVAVDGLPEGGHWPRWPIVGCLVGLLVLASWSVWWEREYLARRAAGWQAGLQLVSLGVPADQIDGGYEWNGWHQRDAAMAEVVQRAAEDGSGRRLNDYIITRLESSKARWVLAFAPPRRSQGGRVLVEVPYWQGQAVYGVARRR